MRVDEGQALVLGLRANHVHELVEKGRQRERRWFELEPSGLDAR